HGAYKPFNGVTVGHFACKVDDNTFLTSIRKTNFNDLSKVGMVKIVTDGPDTVLAYGAKPSVGGQSQRIIFKDHPNYDCVVHFHCPIKSSSKVNT
ncbi:class II aldolase/adducin family protein, partial [Streptomyces caeruleatus]